MRNIVIGLALLLAAIAGGIFFAVSRAKAARLARDKRIRMEIEQRLAVEATPEVIAKASQFEWPLAAPTMSLKEVDEAIAAHVEKTVHPRFSTAEDLGNIVREGRKRFRVYKPGEQVTFRIFAPLGKDSKVSGTLIVVSEGKIHVGSRWIDRGDVHESVQARFFPDVSQRYVDGFVKQRVAEVKQQKAQYAAGLRKKATVAIHWQAGYVKHPESGAWVSREEAVNHIREQTTDRVTREVYIDNGYLLKDGAWCPKSLWDKFRELLNRPSPPD